MNITEALYDAVRRHPGCSSSEAVTFSGRTIDANTAAVALLNLTRAGRLRRVKQDGLYRYSTVTGSTSALPGPASPAAPPFADQSAAIKEGLPKATPARHTVQQIAGNWIVIGMRDESVTLVNRDTDVGMRIDAETIRAIVSIAGNPKGATK